MKIACIKTPDLDWNERKNYITTAIESGIEYIMDDGDVDTIHSLGTIKVISTNENSDVLLLDKKDYKNNKTAYFTEINNKEDEELAREFGKIVDFLIIKSKNWKVIPLENIIADLQKEDVKVLVLVDDIENAKLSLETMEHGADGVVLEVKSFNDIKDLSKLIQDSSSSDYPLKEVTITKITNLGLGDRVCVDTCTMMNPGEGMLVGSYSKALFLVQSESMESEYVASRPFRINAGSVHSYTLSTNSKTRYLSELSSGDEVLILNENGKSFKSNVGRIKLEKRPLLLVEAEYGDISINVILQNAETIRLVNKNGESISVTALKPGDKVLAYIDENARHFGMEINETIVEK